MSGGTEIALGRKYCEDVALYDSPVLADAARGHGWRRAQVHVMLAETSIRCGRQSHVRRLTLRCGGLLAMVLLWWQRRALLARRQSSWLASSCAGLAAETRRRLRTSTSF